MSLFVFLGCTIFIMILTSHLLFYSPIPNNIMYVYCIMWYVPKGTP